MATIARHGRGMYRVLDPASDPNQFGAYPRACPVYKVFTAAHALTVMMNNDNYRKRT